MDRRCIGLDLHRDFCEVAIWERGGVRPAPRVAARSAPLELFARQLRPTDWVVMEATSNALAIAKILRPHVARVVIANTRQVAAISQSKNKTDRHDARLLAQLLAAGMLDHGAWQPDEPIRRLRRQVARRAKLVIARTRAKNEVYAVLCRNLAPRPPMTDPFGVAGRKWLAQQRLPDDERDTIDAALRQIDFLNGEVAVLEREMATFVLASQDARRLLTIPGVGLGTAAVFIAHAGDITRFATPSRLTGYLGLDPRVRQSGNSQANTGRISKEGAALVRHVLVEAALTAVRTPGPLRGFYLRIRARRGHQIAIVATARKLAALCWHLLTRGEDYAYTMPTSTAKKMRRIELKAGAPRRKPPGVHPELNREQRLQLERQAAARAQAAYERTVTDWHRQQRQRQPAPRPIDA